MNKKNRSNQAGLFSIRRIASRGPAPVLPGLVLFLTGTSSLMLEMIWARRLAIIHGGTVPAGAAALCAYLAGLAIGAAWLGRRADRIARPQRFLGLLQFGIGLWALLSMMTPLFLPEFYALLTHTLGLSRALVPFFLAMFIFLPPAILMGGTLPIAVCWQEKVAFPNVASAAGLLRFVNCAGAAGGALLAAGLLIPRWGLNATTFSAALLAFFAAAIAGAARYRAKNGLSEPGLNANQANVAEISPENQEQDPGFRQGALVLAFLAGSLVMLCQIAQFRALSFLTSGTLAAFGSVSAVYIFALGAGALIGGGLLGRVARRRIPLMLAASFALVGAGAGSSLPLLQVVSGEMIEHLRTMDAGSLLRAALAITPTALPLGLMFPLLIESIQPARNRAGRAVGNISAAMEAGSITGPALVALVILPILGTRLTLILAVALATGLAIIVFWGRFGVSIFCYPLKQIPGTILLAGIGTATLIPAWQTHIYQEVILEQLERDVGAEGEIVEIEEGIEGIVSVGRGWNDFEGREITLMYIGRKMQSEDSTPWRRLEKTMGALPSLLCPRPGGRAFHIGLGSGVTAASSKAAAPERFVRVAELVPGVVEQMKRFHPAGAVSFDIVIGEGRALLAAEQEPLDLIVTDIVFPESAGAGGLFSREYFEMTRLSLSEGGVFMHWLPLWQMSPRAFQSTVQAFLDVYPDATLWAASLNAARPLAGLLGQRNAKKGFDPESLAQRLAQRETAAADLGDIDLDSIEGILARFVAGPEQLAELAGSVSASTDDRPLPEFYVTGKRNVNPGIENLELLLSAWSADIMLTAGVPPAQEESGLEPQTTGMTDLKEKTTVKRGARRELAEINLALGKAVTTGWTARRVLPLLERMSIIRLQAPDDPEIAYEYWTLLLDVAESAFKGSKMDMVRQVLEMALDVGPKRDFIMRRLALAKAVTGEPGDGLEEAREACRLRPENPENWKVLQQVALSAGNENEARHAADQAQKAAAGHEML